MKMYDVSMTITEGMQVYKNKESKQPRISVVQDFDTAPCRESRVDMDVHCGTHVDSPLHMLPDGGTMESIPLERLVGPCQVLDLTDVTGGITRADLEKFDIRQGGFYLLKTKNSFQEAFDFDFVFLAEDGAEYLASKGISGVGIDALGIERAQAGHPTHKTLFRADVIIMEGLRLKEVPEGEYFMVAAPIKLLTTEAAPARVILFEGVTV
ncbi:cyclase [Laceyella sacchari]|jgi:arylformamidase|uniref:Kynurenine formamidase n=2 Tax=Laceyella TaxID=292635 RepID=A0AA45WQY5_9BACL|nr:MULTISPECIES: cyclase family protein [Laceyella]AUS08488.1 cyclase [Laceyella sacchari]MRG28545.1 cyclase family protein [Laceyella tengchongensis]PRZ13093.1 kynurenine formamidase [Laceyella sediminis]SMP28395.1 Kynurenine formamidase [Laceyella tengchongensis]